MGKNKLRKFSELSEIDFVYQYPFARLAAEGFPMRGRWHEVFGNDRPIVLELGCGKGEYTVGMARKDPSRNYIGVDIKGARMHSGATAAKREGLTNVAFIRTSIELLERFFAPGEVADIWITFPDPQMKKVNKRLTSARFLDSYREIAGPRGIVNLKTDSPFLYEFTKRIIALNDLELLEDSADLYAGQAAEPRSADKAEAAESESLRDARAYRTAYERQWLARGKKIKFLRFRLSPAAKAEAGAKAGCIRSLLTAHSPLSPIMNPEESDIEKDDYRAYPRFDQAKEAPVSQAEACEYKMKRP